MTPQEPILSFATAQEYEAWLAAHHEDTPGIWVKIAKKGTGISSITYEEALDVALCYGWIDGLLRSIDEKFYKQRFTPRRPKSNWSKLNIQRAQRLIVAGRMQPAGLREITVAKKDGRWNAANQ